MLVGKEYGNCYIMEHNKANMTTNYKLSAILMMSFLLSCHIDSKEDIKQTENRSLIIRKVNSYRKKNRSALVSFYDTVFVQSSKNKELASIYKIEREFSLYNKKKYNLSKYEYFVVDSIIEFNNSIFLNKIVRYSQYQVDNQECNRLIAIGCYNDSLGVVFHSYYPAHGKTFEFPLKLSVNNSEVDTVYFLKFDFFDKIDSLLLPLPPAPSPPW